MNPASRLASPARATVVTIEGAIAAPAISSARIGARRDITRRTRAPAGPGGGPRRVLTDEVVCQILTATVPPGRSRCGQPG